MDLITCNAFLGGTKEVKRERLEFRPSVYGFVVDGDRVLLMNTIKSGLYSLPGGGIELGERMEEALAREIQEEAGIEVEVGRFVRFKEEFFYYDPLDVAFHSFLFYFICQPLSLELALEGDVQDEAVDKPQWVTINALQIGDFHDHGAMAMMILQSLLRSHLTADE